MISDIVIHKMYLNDEPFKKTKYGTKRIEKRLYDEKRQNISVGDHILFTNMRTGEQVEVIVTALHKFNDFNELFSAFSKDKLGYTADENADPENMKKYYTSDQIEKHGVLAIEFELGETRGYLA